MIEILKCLSYVEGYLTAMSAIMQDREYTNDSPGRITSETLCVVRKLHNTEAYIEEKEHALDHAMEINNRLDQEIERLKREVKDWEDLHTDADTQAVIDAGR